MANGDGDGNGGGDGAGAEVVDWFFFGGLLANVPVRRCCSDGVDVAGNIDPEVAPPPRGT